MFFYECFILNALLRKQAELTNVDDYVYLRVERKDRNETHHKVMQVAEGPYHVMETDYKTAVIEKVDRFVEKVFRSRAVLVPKPKLKEEMEEILKPTSVKDNDTNIQRMRILI